MSAWRTIRVVAGREFRERGRSRAFIVSTAILLLAVLAAGVVPALLAGRDADEHVVGVVDVGAGPAREALRALDHQVDGEVRLREFSDRSSAEVALRDGDVDLVVAGDDEVLVREATDLRNPVVESATELLRLAAAARAAGDRAGAVVREGVRAEGPDVRPLDPLDRERLSKLAAAGIAVFLLFVVLMSANSLLLTGVVEEKTSRVVEVVVSAAGVRNLLVGKVLGLGALGLAQLAVIMSPGILLAVQVAAAGLLPSGWPALLGWMLVWFLLGYAFYGFLIAAVGSLVSRMEDVQVTAMPVMLLLLTAFYAAIPAVASPDAPFAVALSFVPPTAPGVMLVRVAVGAAPAWQVLAAITVMVAAIAVTVRLAARIYAVGVLHKGQRLKLRQALRTGQP